MIASAGVRSPLQCIGRSAPCKSRIGVCQIFLKKIRVKVSEKPTNSVRSLRDSRRRQMRFISSPTPTPVQKTQRDEMRRRKHNATNSLGGAEFVLFIALTL